MISLRAYVAYTRLRRSLRYESLLSRMPWRECLIGKLNFVRRPMWDQMELAGLHFGLELHNSILGNPYAEESRDLRAESTHYHRDSI